LQYKFYVTPSTLNNYFNLQGVTLQMLVDWLKQRHDECPDD